MTQGPSKSSILPRSKAAEWLIEYLGGFSAPPHWIYPVVRAKGDRPGRIQIITGRPGTGVRTWAEHAAARRAKAARTALECSKMLPDDTPLPILIDAGTLCGRLSKDQRPNALQLALRDWLVGLVVTKSSGSVADRFLSLRLSGDRRGLVHVYIYDWHLLESTDFGCAARAAKAASEASFLRLRIVAHSLTDNRLEEFGNDIKHREIEGFDSARLKRYAELRNLGDGTAFVTACATIDRIPCAPFLARIVAAHTSHPNRGPEFDKVFEALRTGLQSPKRTLPRAIAKAIETQGAYAALLETLGCCAYYSMSHEEIIRDLVDGSPPSRLQEDLEVFRGTHVDLRNAAGGWPTLFDQVAAHLSILEMTPGNGWRFSSPMIRNELAIRWLVKDWTRLKQPGALGPRVELLPGLAPRLNDKEKYELYDWLISQLDLVQIYRNPALEGICRLAPAASERFVPALSKRLATFHENPSRHANEGRIAGTICAFGAAAANNPELIRLLVQALAVDPPNERTDDCLRIAIAIRPARVHDDELHRALSQLRDRCGGDRGQQVDAALARN